MLTLWLLVGYLLIGVVYAYNMYRDIVEIFQDELDDSDPSDPRKANLIKQREDLYRQMRNLVKVLGNNLFWALFMVAFTLFWLPSVCWQLNSKLRERMSR
jgi:hypothetical protein